MARHRTPGKGWSYGGAVGGGAVSIAANVAHSYVIPPGAPAGWHPEVGAVVSAVVWPLALFVAVEILARTVWPQGFLWYAIRFAGLVPVAGVAAFVSYRHLSGLLAHYGEDAIITVVGPLAVDGLMIMATAAIIAQKRNIALVPVLVPDRPIPQVQPVPIQRVEPQPMPAEVVAPTPERVPELPAPEPVKPALPLPVKKTAKKAPARGAIIPIPKKAT